MDNEEKIKLARANPDIPSDEIRQDIADTAAEIKKLDRERQGYELIGDKMSAFYARNREIQIEERRKFIVKLQGILDGRKLLTDIEKAVPEC